MAKHRRGLHKEITSIFDGVPLPKGDDTKQPRRDSSPNQNDNQQGRLSSSPLVISSASRDAWRLFKLSAFPYLGLIFLTMCLDIWLLRVG